MTLCDESNFLTFVTLINVGESVENVDDAINLGQCFTAVERYVTNVI